MGLAGSLAGGLPALGEEFSPHTGPRHPVKVYWGDTHLHSSLSTDAFGFGVRLGADEALRFAAGEEVSSSAGLKARLDRPLDFVLLADHAESLGMMERVLGGDAGVMGDEQARSWNAQLNSGPEGIAEFRKLFFARETRDAAFSHLGALATPEMQHSIWHETLRIAESHNRPGVFSTLLGFEWTLDPGGSNMHRVVVFRDGSGRVGKVQPFSASQGAQPEDLWRYLAAYESTTGGQVLAIPHNGNLSNGLMFPDTTSFGGSAVDRRYAETRMRWEPVVEVTQIKGDGETHPLLSPDDEFADYETWDFGNFDGIPKTPEMLPFEYARAALRNGLAVERRTGANPYRFGMIGATDSHTGLATADEDNFFGKHSGVEPTAERWKTVVGRAKGREVLGWQMASSGYAGVWATDNTREALWDALKRREVYATTGPRMTVRFFAGWDIPKDAASAPDIAMLGYAAGVPMGSELRGAGRHGPPRFLVAASRDALGANLDRVQVIKGWIDARGATHERVHDVAWSDPATRRPGADGKLPAVGSTVDVKAATWRNSIGAAELATVWEDPHFDAQAAAFYYVRVLQIPTPRWTTYDAARFGVEMPAEVPMSTQERAYTSPIWYTPRG
jgi:hypothetical protein